MPVNVFSVRLETEDDYALENLKKPQRIELFNRITQQSAGGIAEKARKRMSDMLSPGHRFKVGATGAASQNLTVEPTQVGYMGFAAYAVMEGSNTKANFFIRKGFKPSRRGKLPPEDKIKAWAAAKGVTFYKPRSDKTGRYIRVTPKKGRSYIRATRKDPTEEGLLWLRRYLSLHGSKFSRWKELYPAGAPRFDYVAYTVRQDKMLQDELRKTGNIYYVAFVDFLASGKVPAAGRFFTQSKA